MVMEVIKMVVERLLEIGVMKEKLNLLQLKDIEKKLTIMQ